jgi:hypothetical protein
MRWVARVGYASRGVVFVVLGYFTALAALDARVRPVDSKDALRGLLLEPAGTALLCIIAAGLLCFALWRWTQAFLNADGCHADLKGIARRVVYGAAGAFYAAFASIAISMAVGRKPASTERVVHDWTSWAFKQPFGRWVVGVAGAGILIAALCIGIAGIRAEFKSRLALKEKPRWFVTLLGCAGYLTRAAVFAITGLFSCPRRLI